MKLSFAFVIRKFIHTITGLILIEILRNQLCDRLFLVIIFGSVFLLDLLRIIWRSWNRLFVEVLKPLLKPGEIVGQPTGASVLWISILMAETVFPPHSFRVAATTVVIADPIAAILGKKFGWKVCFGTKTYIGSLSFFIVSFFVLLGYWNIPLYPAVLLSIILSVIELISPSFTENLFLVMIGVYLHFILVS